MKRPGPVGLTIFAVFAVVAAIEMRTVLSMLGIDVTTTVYYPVAALLIVLALAALYLLPGDDEGNERSPPEGNPGEAP